jgi:hypothetical protein
MIPNLHRDWVVMASGPPAEDRQIALLQSTFPSVPAEYVELVRTATEVELKGKGKKYLRIWGPQGCLEMDEGYGISRRIPGAIPIGDNGGNQAVFYLNGHHGSGLYRVGFGNLDAEDAVFIAPSLQELLREGFGLDSL